MSDIWAFMSNDVVVFIVSMLAIIVSLIAISRSFQDRR
jgi:hypothetical protein